MAKTRAEANPSKSKKKKKAKTKSIKLLGNKSLSSSVVPNPFESIWSRSKFNVLGRRRKGQQRRIGLARATAIEKRNKTLLKEYEQSTKSSKFIDKRIGENDEELPESDKGILRLMKLKKRSKFNLPDGEEEEDVFGYEGQSLSHVDDFKDELSPDEDEDALSVSENYLNLHAMDDLPMGSLPDGEENIQKSKKQVMQELILKSKFHKALKAKEKEEKEQLTEKLDNEFTAMAQSEALLSLTRPDKMHALKSLVNKNIPRQSSEGTSKFAENEPEKEKPDPYDKLVKEMSLEMRARPSDRTKTAEEIAQEERERLELLEEERQKRMLSTDYSSGEGSDAEEDHHKSAFNKFRTPSGDDLGDSFAVDEDKRDKRGWVDDILDAKDDYNPNGTTSADGSEDDEDEEVDEDATSGEEIENLSSVEDWEQSDDDADALGAEGEEPAEPEAREEIANHAKAIQAENTESSEYHKIDADGKHLVKQDSLPFVIEAPKNLAELDNLLENHTDAEINEAIHRIRACNSVKLSVENRRKMQVFYGVLLQYFAVSATRRPVNFKLLNLLVKPLTEMSAETPYFAAICARQRLRRIRDQFVEEIKVPENSGWPNFKTLLLMRLWSLIFPCSDFRHVVMTPVILLICEYLMRCRIHSGQDIAIGTFLCSMLHSVAQQSGKFCPEALIFLQTLLISSLESDSMIRKHSEFNYLIELKPLKPWLNVRDPSCDVRHIDFLMVANMEADNLFFLSDNFKASMIMSVVEILRGFLAVYEKLSSFPEIFMPFSALLHEIVENSSIPSILQDKIRGLLDLIKKKSDEHRALRQPLQMRKEKPAPIKLLTPKFEENFVKGRDYDQDRERAERKKLRKQLKQEKKGAIRELRKDNHFIFGVKQRDKLIEKEEREEKYGKERAFLQEQEHAFKSGQLGKGRKRKR